MIEQQQSFQPLKSEAERISDLENRMTMLENAFSMNSKMPDVEKVRKIESFLSAKLGYLPEAPKASDPLKS